ncbi:MAG TPA: hypothetical protein VJ822_07970 [Dongiaceae bacterium]|nr:hypothetical protein [Dongiaceae bacterium]
MESVPLTIADIFLPAESNFDIKAELDGKIISDLSEEIKQLPDIAWSAFDEEIQFALGKALDINLLDVVAEGWSKLKQLRDYCGRKPDDGDKPFSVALAQHKVISNHQPGIDVLLGEKVIGRIVVDVELSLTLKGIVLSIRDDHIIAVASGKFAAAGSVKYRGATLVEKATREYDIPGKWVFDRPFPMPCRQEVAA